MQWWRERRSLLAESISLLTNTIHENGEGVLGKRNWRLEVAVRLIGGAMTGSDTLCACDENEQIDDEGNTPVLNLFATHWGGIGESHLPGLQAHGFVVVANFLALIMPRHKAALFPEGAETADRIAYATTEGEESPVKKRMLTTRPDHSDGKDGHDMSLPFWMPGPLPDSHQASQADTHGGMAAKTPHTVLNSSESESDE